MGACFIKPNFVGKVRCTRKLPGTSKQVLAVVPCDTFTLSPLERNAIFVYPFFCFLHFLLKERDARRSLFQNHCMKYGSTKNYFHLRKRWSTLSLYDFKIEIQFFLVLFL